VLLGYARVSTDDQDAAAQRRALEVAGCERIFKEKASGGRWDRPKLQNLIEQLRPGDVLVVWKLDRLSRSLKDLLHQGFQGAKESRGTMRVFGTFHRSPCCHVLLHPLLAG
jgi:hypothetical protein